MSADHLAASRMSRTSPQRTPDAVRAPPQPAPRPTDPVADAAAYLDTLTSSPPPSLLSPPAAAAAHADGSYVPVAGDTPLVLRAARTPHVSPWAPAPPPAASFGRLASSAFETPGRLYGPPPQQPRANRGFPPDSGFLEAIWRNRNGSGGGGSPVLSPLPDASPLRRGALFHTPGSPVTGAPRPPAASRLAVWAAAAAGDDDDDVINLFRSFADASTPMDEE